MNCVDGNYCPLVANKIKNIECYRCYRFINFYKKNLPKCRLGKIERAILLSPNERPIFESESQKVAWRRATSKLEKLGLIHKSDHSIEMKIRDKSYYHGFRKGYRSCTKTELSGLGEIIINIAKADLENNKKIRWEKILSAIPFNYGKSQSEIRDIKINALNENIKFYQKWYSSTPKILAEIAGIENQKEFLSSLEFEVKGQLSLFT